MPTSHMPPEWAPQDWLWIGFPHLAEEWAGFLQAAQEQIAAFASAVAESGQETRLLVRDEANEARARHLVSEKVVLQRRIYGDIWLRDTGPLVRADGSALRESTGDLVGMDDFIFSEPQAFSAVPEPSSYAAILGGLALGLTALQRRRREPSRPAADPSLS